MNNVLSCLVLMLFSTSALAAAKANPSCEEALFATGDQWMHSSLSPLESVHPGFSKTAKNIYFYLDEPCLEIFIQQGPYGGMNLGANKIERFYIDYDPACFSPWSFYRQIFGSKKISVHIKDEDFSAYYQEAWFGPHAIIQIRIPQQAGAEPWDLKTAVQLIISRDTGMVYGYGPKVGRVKSFFKDVWSELRTNRLAKRGVWYNSNSGMPLPPFYSRQLKRESE